MKYGSLSHGMANLFVKICVSIQGPERQRLSDSWMYPQVPDNGPVTSQDKLNTCLLKEDVSDRHLMTYREHPHPSSYLIFQKALEHKGKLISLSTSHGRGRVFHPGCWVVFLLRTIMDSSPLLEENTTESYTLIVALMHTCV